MSENNVNEAVKKIWPEWTIEEKIGQGAFGAVYRAVKDEEYNLRSYSAIKVIHIPSEPIQQDSARSGSVTADGTRQYYQEYVNEVVDEIKLMQSLKGAPNVVIIEDYKVAEQQDMIGWTIYIRMELLTPLKQYVERYQLSENHIIKLGCDICTALEYCMQRNIVHRDIKPENIFVDAFGNFKLGDFGVAKKLERVDATLSMKGTPYYMAPEMIVGGVSHYPTTVDIYSLGLVLYRMLNHNRYAFLTSEQEMHSPSAIDKAITRKNTGEQLPAPAAASPAMANAVLRACVYDPTYRFQSPTEMKNALLCVQNGTYVMADISHGWKQTETVVFAENVRPSLLPQKKAKWPLFVILGALLAGAVAAFIIGISSCHGGNGDTSSESSKDILSQTNSRSFTSIEEESSRKESSAVSKEEKSDKESSIDEILSEASGLAEKSDYYNAVRLMKENHKAEDNQELYQLWCKEYKNQLIDMTTQMIIESDYLSAYHAMQEALTVLDEDEDILKKKDQYAAMYVSDCISKAKEQRQEKHYDEAEAIITEALSVLPDNNDLLAEQDNIKEARNKPEQSSEVSEESEEESSQPIDGDSDLQEPSGTVRLGSSTIEDNNNNNTAETAQKITLGDNIKGSITPEKDIDFYSFTLTQSGRVTLDMKSYMRYYCMYIYDTSGNKVWYTDQNEYNSTVRFRQDVRTIDLEKGTYSIKVTGYNYETSSPSTGNYELKTSFESAGANEQESNNQAENANVFIPGETINGLIGLNDKIDFYQFTIAHSGKISLDMTSYMKYYSLVIYDMSGNTLWYTHENEYNHTVGFRNDKYNIYLEAGSYYLKVNGYQLYTNDGYFSTGRYTLKTAYTDAKANEKEPNNSTKEANKISFNKEYIGLIGSNDRYDFYEIEIDEKRTVNMDITSYMKYYTINVYNTSGNSVWSVYEKEYNAMSGFRQDMHQITLNKGTYYIKITGYQYGTSNPSTGTYQFTLS